MPPNKPATPGQVAKAAADLRAFWEVGRASWAAVHGAAASPESGPTASGVDGGRKGYVHGNKLAALKASAAEYGLNYDTLGKAWRADRLYTEAQIAELCALVVRHNARFGPSHLSRALAIGDAKARAAMIKKAIRERWGVAKLARAAQAAGGRRGHVGKRPTVPQEPVELLHALAALCEKWGRFYAAARGALPDELKDAVGRASRAVLKVRTAAAGDSGVSPPGSARRP